MNSKTNTKNMPKRGFKHNLEMISNPTESKDSPASLVSKVGLNRVKPNKELVSRAGFDPATS